MEESNKSGMANVHVIVEVWRGMATGVHVFQNAADAESAYNELLVRQKLEDDVQLFETKVV
jgi:hypothetical protein